MAPVKKSKLKPRTIPINLFGALEGMDGNPQTPQEFDDSPHDEDEVFFKADANATEATKKKVLVLNAIHQKLHHNTLRCIPALEGTEFEKEVEVYHRFTYQGQDLDVCAFFAPGRDSNGYKEAFLLVKYTSDDLSDDTECIVTSATWSKEAQADKFSKKHEELSKHYWTPRWKYVVNILRNEMAHRYQKNGTYIPEHKPEVASDEEGEQAANSSEIIEESMEVFAGCTGKLIGPKGSKINELKKASGCKDIKMPEKDESADRPKARSPVSITLVGTARQIAKARKLVQEVVDEWSNAPRQPRNVSGGGGSGDGWNNGVPPPTEFESTKSGLDGNSSEESKESPAWDNAGAVPTPASGGKW